MPTPPIFQRSPRIYPEMPKGEIEIQPPVAMPSAAQSNMVMTLLPRLGIVGGLSASLIAAFAFGTQGNLTYVGAAMGFTVISTATAIYTFVSQKRTYKKTMTVRAERYGALLETRKKELMGMRDRQLAALEETDPDPMECLMRVERLDRRLWQRSPQDPDFLALRVGLGAEPFAVKIKAPKQDALLDIDPLITEANELADEFASVPNAPIRLPLYQAGAAGLAGSRKLVLNTARALAVQIATHHSPDEVKICALYPAEEAEHWDWLRWLPHTWTDDRSHRFLACEKEEYGRLLKSFYELLSRRRSQVASSKEIKTPPPLPFFVFFLADEARLAENRPVMRMLLYEGQALGALPILLTNRYDNLPKACKVIVELASGNSQLILTGPTPSTMPVVPDVVPVELAERLARSAAPIRLRGDTGSVDIPNEVPLLDMLGASDVEDLNVAGRWRSSEAFRSLAVPIGRRAGGELHYLDLHERGAGPHGLVAGTTRSGKSELLQSMIASLASNFHPHQVSFVLVDYKGGGMADAFVDLPHLAGIITNLQGNLATRALFALRSELQRRQALLAQARENHIDKYQRRYAQGELSEPLPRLIIIVDEFAELAMEQPDFMKQLVSAVRVGGSLGVHLILATQKPAGVVSEEIWANSRFRVCLRVARPEDSREVIRKPDAASITQPGRAYFQVGQDEIFELFQSAYGGAAYEPDGDRTSGADEIMEVALDGSRRALRLSPKPVAVQAAKGTQLQALVSHLREVAEQEEIPPLQGPWLPPLPELVTLEQVRPAEGWDGQTWRDKGMWLDPVVGLVDDPTRQHQGPLTVNLGKEGHLLVYGAPGTGKSTFVQTLITSLALDHSPQDLNLYLLDFGGRTLAPFGSLPHVGATILPDEAERLNRLLRYLQRELESRQMRFSGAGVTTLAAYRRATGEPVPAIVVVLDNYAGFSGSYPEAEDTLALLSREGGNLGIHLVLTANSPSIKSKVSGNITAAVAFQLADKTDYAVALGRLSGLEPAPLTGRGLVKGTPPLEFQAALPAEDESEADRTARLRELFQRMDEVWSGPRARPIGARPTVVPLSEVLQPDQGWPILMDANSLIVPIGVDLEDLDPTSIDLSEGPHFLVTGPLQSGKTTLLQSWALGLAERLPPHLLHLYLVDFRRAGLHPLRQLPHVKSYIENDEALNAALDEITKVLQERRVALEEARREAVGSFDDREFIAQYPVIVVMMDDYDAVRDGAQMGTKTKLEGMIRRERGLGLHLILAGATNDVGPSFEAWVKAMKEQQTGVVVGSSDQNDVNIIGIRLPFGEGSRLLPPGEGFYGRRGRVIKLKVATPHAGDFQLRNWVAQLAARGS